MNSLRVAALGVTGALIGSLFSAAPALSNGSPTYTLDFTVANPVVSESETLFMYSEFTNLRLYISGIENQFFAGSSLFQIVENNDADGSNDVPFTVNFNGYIAINPSASISEEWYTFSVLVEYDDDGDANTPRVPITSDPLSVQISNGELPLTDVYALGVDTVGPVVGDTVYATAVEKHLPMDLYVDPSQHTAGLEQYSYRITSTPNDISTSLDPQGVGDLDILTAAEQDTWYDNDFGGVENYDFSWRAFLCDGIGGLSIPTDLFVVYSSLEDAYSSGSIIADENADLRGLVARAAQAGLPSNQTFVGSDYYDVKGSWGASNYNIPTGVSTVVGDCPNSPYPEGFTILDSDGNPITSKDFTIPETLNISVGGNAQTFPSEGVTIGVTGAAFPSFDFDAALWGITTIQTSESQETAAPTPYTGPVVTSSTDAAASGTVTVAGERLATVSSVSVDGVEIPVSSPSESSFSFVLPAGITPGLKDLRLIGPFGTLVAQGAFTVLGSVASQGEAFAWTKLQHGGNSVKLYAKDIVAAGKVQFMLGGKEIAWVRAIDAADPKLSFANGFSYLVRTVDLASGKNRFEIRLDGVRVWRATYVPKG